MESVEQTVFVVDDDDDVRDAIRLLLKSVGLQAEVYASAADFLDAYADRPGCAVLDIRMPGMSGLDLQKHLIEQHAILPIIFVSGHGDVPMAVEAMQHGAVNFILKPFRDQELLDLIQQALETDSENRTLLQEREAIVERINSLTDREREVMERVVDGQANKVIAIELGVSQRTVEIHRAHVMEKMQSRSIAHLVRMVMQAQQ